MNIIFKRAILSFKGRVGKSVLYILFSMVLGFCIAVIACYITAGNSYVTEIAKGIDGRVILTRTVYDPEETFSPKDSWINALNYHSNIEYFEHMGDSVSVYLRDYEKIESTVRELNKMISDEEYEFMDFTDSQAAALYSSVKLSLGLQNLTLYIAVAVLIAVFFVLFINMSLTFNKDKQILIRLGETKGNVFKQFLSLQLLWVYIPLFVSSVIGLMLNGVISKIWISTVVVDSAETFTNYESQRNALELLQIDGHIMQFLSLVWIFLCLYCVAILLYRKRMES